VGVRPRESHSLRSHTHGFPAHITADRGTDGLWVHTGRLIVRSTLELQPPEGGLAELILPDSTITTRMLAPQACQQMLDSFVQLVSFSVPQTGVWVETPARVDVVFDGSPVRIEFTFAVSCPTKGQHVAWGIMADGADPLVILGGLDAPEASFGSMAAGCYYLQPAAGAHRLGIGLRGPSGTLMSNTVATTLYVTEQKR
jgi:hypothetical protein